MRACAWQVERSQDVASKKEQRRKERTESGGGRAQFVSDLQSAVFRRKITEVCKDYRGVPAENCVT